MSKLLESPLKKSFFFSSLFCLFFLLSCNEKNTYNYYTTVKEEPAPTGTGSLPGPVTLKAHNIPDDFFKTPNSGDQTLKIASYNVENFFNWTHEHLDYFNGHGPREGRDVIIVEDLEYLPRNAAVFQSDAYFARYNSRSKDAYCDQEVSYNYRSTCKKMDRTEEMVRLKLNKIKLAIDKLGDRPDILAIQEVEHASDDSVYTAPNSPHVAPMAMLQEALGYDAYKVTHGSDARAIQNGLLYKTDKLAPLGEGTELAADLSEEQNQKLIDYFDNKPTRNILMQKFLVRDGQPDEAQRVLIVYVKHWPSQGHESRHRNIMAKTLINSMREQRNEYGDRAHFVVLGDFNTLDEEKYNPALQTIHAANPTNVVLQNPDLEDLALQDVHDYARGLSRELQSKHFERGAPFKNALISLGKTLKNHLLQMPKGTYWYYPENAWNRFDRIFMSTNLFATLPALKEDLNTAYNGLKVDPESYRIVAPVDLLKESEVEDFVTQDRTYLRFATGTRTWTPKKYNFITKDKAEAGYSDHLPVQVTLRFSTAN